MYWEGREGSISEKFSHGIAWTLQLFLKCLRSNARDT